MKEEYLHYLHRFKLLGSQFETVNGELLEIIDFGRFNTNAGPDFLEGKVRLDGQLWAGPIEFHVKSSDWYLHGHQHDAAYNNVIAHFVYEHDAAVFSGSHLLPTVELKSKVDRTHYERYTGLAGSKSALPCINRLKEIDPFVIFQQKEKALVQRLLRKSAAVLNDIKNYQGDLEKSFYLALARVFGGPVNAAAFEALVAKADLHGLRRLDRESSMPAVLFGLSGLLPADSNDHYICDLINEFNFQMHRLSLKPMSQSEWRYSRMHAHSFPDIRLAQFVAFFQKNIPVEVFSDPAISVKQIRSLLSVKLPAWWDTHYRFENVTTKKSSTLSIAFVDLVIINAIVPFLFANGILRDQQQVKEKALDLLTQLKSEKNNILRLWANAGIESTSAFDSQALIEQKNAFCSAKKCLFCSIGTKLLRA